MTLVQKQTTFARLAASLILRMSKDGYAVTFGEAYRTPEQAALNAKAGTGIKDSLHTQKLAIDLNLFKDGTYLATTDAHQPFGDWWEQLSTPDYTCCWGGRFGDGNHYSISHDGRK